MRITLLLIVLLSISSAGFAASQPSFFNSEEVASSNLSYFPKWRKMMERHFDDKHIVDTCRRLGNNDLCHLDEWRRLFSSVRDKSVREKIERVHRYLNQSPYIVDQINWGLSDYWETPKEFSVKSGDCEDYAIAKFMSLRALGVPNEAMRVVVLEDENLRVLHSVLVVYVQGQAFVLDNQISQVVPASQIHHYKPIYSINETRWWRHRT